MRARRPVVAGLLASLLAASPAVAVSAMATPTPAGAEITNFSATVRVNADGSLHVAEAATYDFAGQPTSQLDRVIVTREHYDAQDDRVYDLDAVDVDAVQPDVDVDFEISSAEATDTISVEFAEPQSERVTVRFEYDVDGAAAETADGLEVRWPVVQGFDLPIDEATIRWNTPNLLWLSCLAGPAGSSRPCTTAQMSEVASPTMTQLGLTAGEQMVGIVGLSLDSGISPSADFEARWSLARSFAATGTPLWVALAVLALGLLAALALWLTRGRDTGRADAVAVHPLVDGPDGDVAFAPPSAVRPGQMGTLVDERVDVVDVSATVIDLAVRNYLFVEELPHDGYGRRDWLLRRRNQAGDELLPYEREVFEALFADGDEVEVSALDDSLRERLPGVQALLYDDMVAQLWFGERPDSVRGKWTTAGWVLVAAGAVLTLVLALASTFGLVG
ncbi:MAG: DUF2207 domain-containing protein, partial [Nocardioidaceae bacterium]|nr:DUF2207 domain-containing protein [Nocardioidaceae bacterium]